MLNKITGCESRTVPPLYVLMAGSIGESRSLGETLGRPIHPRESSPPQSMSQKTYALAYSHFRVITEVCLSQKNGCGVLYGCRSLFEFLEDFL